MHHNQYTHIVVRRSYDKQSQSYTHSSIGEAGSSEDACAIAHGNGCEANYGDILIVVNIDNIHDMLDKSEAAYFIDKSSRSIKVSNRDNNLLKLWEGSDADADTMLGKASECMDDKIITLAAIACARTAMSRIPDKRAYAVADEALSATADYCAGIGKKVKAMKAAEVFLAHYREAGKPRYLLPVSSAISINFNPKSSSARHTPYHVANLLPDDSFSILTVLPHTVRSVIPAHEFLEAMWKKATERLIK